MAYKLTVDEVKVPGQRKRYVWTLFDEENRYIIGGDSYFKWNAKRSGRRAASRHHNGDTFEPDLYVEEINL